MEESLLRTNFVGRDGFIWWIGQIPPVDAWIDQANGKGWGNRYKVRIMGYHPYNTNELSDEDLPWAGVILPPGNTGSAGVSKSVKFQPGDTVIGFFMDGENGQIPMIFGCFGNSQYAAKDGEPIPFGSFTGYTDKIKKPAASVVKADESNEPNAVSKQSPRHLSPADAKSVDKDNPAAYSASEGAVVKLPTDEVESIEKISTAIENFSFFLKNVRAQFDAGLDYVKEWVDREIGQRVRQIKDIASGLVGGMVNSLFERLVPILKKGLEMLYKSVYATVLAATGNPVIAHLAGVAAQKAMAAPIKIMQDLVPCIVNSVLDKVGDLVKGVLTAISDNVLNFVECVADQSVGSILNGVIGFIDGALGPAIGGIQKIIQFFKGFSIDGLLRDGISSLVGMIGLASCGKNKEKFPGPKKYRIGQGPIDQAIPDLSAIMKNANIAKAQGAIDGVNDIMGAFDIFSDTIKDPKRLVGNVGSCFAGIPTVCNPPQIKIFGGGGSGASAIPILGNLSGETGSLINVKITNPGSGYTFPPFVEVVDNCKQGYGAICRATIKNGQVDRIYVESEGENYPVDEVRPQVVTNIDVIDPGIGYQKGDVAVDDQGNEYNTEVYLGSIVKVTPINIKDTTDLPILSVRTRTGSGARLLPTLGDRPDREVQRVIDCVT